MDDGDGEEARGAVLRSISQIEEHRGPGLVLFLGISTGGSSVHRAFLRWAPLLAPGAVLRGVDLPEDAPASAFRRLVIAMRDNPRVHGAVITSHKLRLFRAISDLLDRADPLVALTHEINALDTREGRIAAHARDAQSLDIVLDTTGGPRSRPDRPILCLGAGGTATALLLAARLDIEATLRTGVAEPRRGGALRGPLTLVDRREEALADVEAVRERAGPVLEDIRLVLAADADAVGGLVRTAAPGTLLVNATGLGKLSPHSPLSEGAIGPDLVAWDLNYRGPLTFLAQARAAGAVTADGWDLFLAGWTAALAAIGGRNLTEDLVQEVRSASAGLRA